MRIIDMEYIQHSMEDQNAFVMRCEELYHDKIGSAAATIITARDKGNNIVCLTGPSGSGKTTTAMRLKQYLENLCVPVHMLSMDNFFFPERLKPAEATDWESPYYVDRGRLFECLEGLRQGKNVELPTFDFTRSDYGPTYFEQGNPDAVIIVEGIHMLNPLIFDELKSKATGVYVAPRTRILTNDEKVISPQMIRVARRMLRDYTGRGRTFLQTIENAKSVDEGEMKYIYPYRFNAAVRIDSFHDYEPCLLVQYLKNFPMEKTGMTLEYARENGLLDWQESVKNLPGLTTKYIPRDSLMREFIGGSIFKY